MDRKQRISQSLDKINKTFHKVFEWLTCEDLGRDWDGVGNPYGNKCHIAGQDGATGGQDSGIVKNS
jgi:hypothetical protein